MSLPQVVIVDDPTVAIPDSGTFVRLTSEKISITDLWFSVWSLHVQTLVGGQLMPGEIKFTEIRIDEVITQLQSLNHLDVYIYMTLESAQELLPLMCRPQVPFALVEPNAELRELCVSQLSMNLRLGK